MAVRVAPLVGRVAVGASDCTPTGIRVQGADRATDVGAIGQQGAAGGEGVARSWGEAARDAAQAGARARWREQVAGSLRDRAMRPGAIRLIPVD